MDGLRAPVNDAGPARVLIAEDHMDSRDALQALLEANGYAVTAVRDGREALAQAEELNPDIILMDIMMPVMDGLAATRELRSRPQFASTPIIALTAMEGGRERAQIAGCDDFIMKPIELQILYQKVRWWIVNGRGTPLTREG